MNYFIFLSPDTKHKAKRHKNFKKSINVFIEMKTRKPKYMTKI